MIYITNEFKKIKNYAIQKKFEKEYFVGVIISILSLIASGLIAIGFAFGTLIVDTGDLENGVNNRTSNFYDFIIETTGYSTIHHVKDALTVILVAMMLIFNLENSLDVFFDRSPTFKGKIIVLHYTGIVLISIGISGAWEIIERVVVFSTEILLLIWPDDLAFLQSYIGSGEPCHNVVLSDLLQSAIAPIGIVILHYWGIFKPVACLIWEKSIKILILRFGWLLIVGVCSIPVGIFQSDWGWTIFPVGFYVYGFLLIFALSIIYLEDVHHITRRNGNKIMSLKELNECYVAILWYLLFQWVFAFNLFVPGLIFSNLGFVVYIIFMYIWKYKIVPC